MASAVHRQETVDCLKKFNARRKLKVRVFDESFHQSKWHAKSLVCIRYSPNSLLFWHHSDIHDRLQIRNVSYVHSLFKYLVCLVKIALFHNYLELAGNHSDSVRKCNLIFGTHLPEYIEWSQRINILLTGMLSRADNWKSCFARKKLQSSSLFCSYFFHSARQSLSVYMYYWITYMFVYLLVCLACVLSCIFIFCLSVCWSALRSLQILSATHAHLCLLHAWVYVKKRYSPLFCLVMFVLKSLFIYLLFSN